MALPQSQRDGVQRDMTRKRETEGGCRIGWFRGGFRESGGTFTETILQLHLTNTPKYTITEYHSP